MVDLTLYISHAVAIAILCINGIKCINKHHKLENEVKELAETNRFSAQQD